MSILLKIGLVPRCCLIFFQYCSIGFNSGLYGRSLIIFTWFSLTKDRIAFVKCHRALSMMMHSFLQLFLSLLMNGRNFFEFIFGLSFVKTSSTPRAPNTWIFWNEFSTYFTVGCEPFLNHPLTMCGSSLKVHSSRKRISYPRFLKALILLWSFF